MNNFQNEFELFALDVEQLRFHLDRGYLYFYMPDHPLAVQNGMVPVHRHVASVATKRWLTSAEKVVFVNGDRSDFALDNLKIVTNAELLEMITCRPDKVLFTCAQCGKTMMMAPAMAKRRRHCSRACDLNFRNKIELSPEELADLVWEMPTTHIAKMLGVSDKAIEKRCKKHGIKKPPRGYWAKLYAGQREPLLEEELRQKEVSIPKE